MKMLVLALASSLLLAACSGGGGGSGAPAGPRNPTDFDPSAKPANPAAQTYVQGALLTLNESTKYVPGDEAIFSSVISHGTVKDVSAWEQQNAVGQLELPGQDFASRIRANCTLNPAKATQTGQPGENQSVTSTGSLSSSGANCGYLINQSFNNVANYGKASVNNSTGDVSIPVTITNNQKESRQVTDSGIMNYSNVVAIEKNIHFSIPLTATINQHNGVQKTQGTGYGKGTFKVKFANGHVIEGPVYSLMSLTSETGRDSKMDMRIRFDGKSPEGDFYVVIVMTNSSVKAAVNGQEVSPNDVVLFLSLAGF
jgi:hypothetical protein